MSNGWAKSLTSAKDLLEKRIKEVAKNALAGKHGFCEVCGQPANHYLYETKSPLCSKACLNEFKKKLKSSNITVPIPPPPPVAPALPVAEPVASQGTTLGGLQQVDLGYQTSHTNDPGRKVSLPRPSAVVDPGSQSSTRLLCCVCRQPAKHLISKTKDPLCGPRCFYQYQQTRPSKDSQQQAYASVSGRLATGGYQHDNLIYPHKKKFNSPVKKKTRSRWADAPPEESDSEAELQLEDQASVSTKMQFEFSDEDEDGLQLTGVIGEQQLAIHSYRISMQQPNLDDVIQLPSSKAPAVIPTSNLSTSISSLFAAGRPASFSFRRSLLAKFNQMSRGKKYIIVVVIVLTLLVLVMGLFFSSDSERYVSLRGIQASGERGPTLKLPKQDDLDAGPTNEQGEGIQVIGGEGDDAGTLENPQQKSKKGKRKKTVLSGASNSSVPSTNVIDPKKHHNFSIHSSSITDDIEKVGEQPDLARAIQIDGKPES